MVKRLLASTLLVFAAPAFQGLSAQQIDPQSIAWADFVRQHGDGWVADWSKSTTTPKAIYGPGLRVKDGQIASLPPLGSPVAAKRVQ